MIRRRKPLRRTGIKLRPATTQQKLAKEVRNAWKGLDRRPKTLRDELIEEADGLWKQAVFARDGHRCRRCKGTWALAAHHVVTRGKRSVRWVLANGVTLDRGCHFWVHRVMRQSQAVEFYASIGADLEAMERQSEQSWKDQDIALIIVGLKMGVA